MINTIDRFLAKLGLYYPAHKLSLATKLLLGIIDSKVKVRTTKNSYKEYNSYNEDYYERQEAPKICIFENKLQYKTPMMVREANLKKYLFPQISGKKDFKILEVGCGGALNLLKIREEFPNVQLFGFDNAEERIKMLNEKFPDLDMNIICADATKKLPYKENDFDLVFSMHCLEQIPYYSAAVLKEMVRVCKHSIVLLEPDFSKGNSAQRLYMMIA